MDVDEQKQQALDNALHEVAGLQDFIDGIRSTLGLPWYASDADLMAKIESLMEGQ